MQLQHGTSLRKHELRRLYYCASISHFEDGNCDRAAVVTTALLHIILSSSTPRSELRQHVEELLRDEFADVERQAAADRADVDA